MNSQTIIKDSLTRHTKTRTGTCNYLSPQAFKGKINEASSVWAYGMVLYEIGIRGELPFEGMPDFQILSSVDQKINPNMNEIKPFYPRTLINIMVQCWKYKTKARPSPMRSIPPRDFNTIVLWIMSTRRLALLSQSSFALYSHRSFSFRGPFT